MASTSSSKAHHGILKGPDHECPDNKKKPDHASFDEMNILATYHPADKDYGHMKIDEPKTPYRNDSEGEDSLNADILADRLQNPGQGVGSSRQRTTSTDDSDEDNLTPEARERKKKFRDARKQHYHMKEEMQKAKELIAKEMAELEDED